MNNRKPELLSKPLDRKKNLSIKNKNPPVIKQTRTSMFRMVNANPLLLRSNNNDKIDIKKELSNIEIPKSFNLEEANKEIKYLNRVPSFRQTAIKTSSIKKVKPVESTSSGLPLIQPNVFNKKSEKDLKKPNMSSTKSNKENEETIFIKPIVPKIVIKPNLTSKVNGLQNDVKKNPVRRSLSAEHYDRQNKKVSDLQKFPRGRDVRVIPNQKSNTKRRSMSAEKFDPKFMGTNRSSESKICISPVIKDGKSRLYPSNLGMRNKLTSKAYFSTPVTSVNKNNSNVGVQERLNEWLRTRGQPLSSYSHLKCFGINSDIQEIQAENKENIEEVSCLSDSYEALNILEEPYNNQNTNDLKNVARDALNDLYSLIHDDYSEIQCLTWLNLIYEKCPEIVNYPKYWECRAAIEQFKGNLTDAIECYKKAVVKGADLEEVDVALEDLLKKFSVLNISCSSPEKQVDDNKLKREKAFVLQQARNAFKSSIIQFAIKEQNNETNNEESLVKFVVTPVRRSVRFSKTKSSTPGIRIRSTLVNEVDNEHMIFKNNKALEVRFN